MTQNIKFWARMVILSNTDIYQIVLTVCWRNAATLGNQASSRQEECKTTWLLLLRDLNRNCKRITSRCGTSIRKLFKNVVVRHALTEVTWSILALMASSQSCEPKCSCDADEFLQTNISTFTFIRLKVCVAFCFPLYGLCWVLAFFFTRWK